MSAETVARWNAIPLERPQPDQTATASLLKRPRTQDDDNDDDSEDNVSLVSRSPSPPPPDAMDIDKYDEYYAHKPEHDVITVETKIKSTNVGFSMLAKMGWVEGSPLGLSGDGRVDPIPFYVKNDLTGLGKVNQDVRMIESTVSQRRELDSERQIKETEEQRRQRENSVAKRAAVKSEISTVLRPFYCEVCEKQFQNVAQYDEHTNSYAHHHKVRFRDMQAAQRASRNTDVEVNKRKEKERKREEKELRKIAKAAGIKMAKPPTPLAAVPDATPTGDSSKLTALKKGSWATVSTPTATPFTTSTEPSKWSGWAAVGDAPSSSSSSRGRGWSPATAPPPAPPTDAPPSPTAPIPSRVDYSSAPSFRTGGWTSLETSSNPPLPPPSPTPTPPSPPLPSTYDEQRSGWAHVTESSAAGGRRNATNDLFPVAPPDPSIPAEPIKRETSRSGWQKFRAGAPGRRR